MKSNLDEMKVNEAIKTYPLEELPSGFVDSVLNEIKPHQHSNLKHIYGANTRFLFTAVPLIIFILAASYALLDYYKEYWLGTNELYNIQPVLEQLSFIFDFTANPESITYLILFSSLITALSLALKNLLGQSWKLDMSL